MKRVATTVLLVACATACSDRPTAPLVRQQAASTSTATNESANPLDIAVIGDTPYGSAAIALFPTMVDAINADPKVREVVHIGDLKSGSEQCSDARLQLSPDLYRRGSNASRHVRALRRAGAARER